MRPCFAWLPIVLAASSVACAKSTRVDIGSGGSGGSGGGASVSSGSAGAGGASVSASSSSGTGGCTVASDCSQLSDACNVGTCVNAICQKMPANDFAACDDGDFCTETDTCQGGVCTGGSAKFCPSGDACHVGACDSGAQACTTVPGNDGASCDDGDACTANGVCSQGMCSAGTPIDCSFLDGTCAVGFCDPQLGCQQMPKNDGAPCDDSLFCTINDTCQAGVCTGAPNTCAAPGDVCLVGSCNEISDSCTAVPGNEGGACDDKSTCTTGEKCSNGKCAGGAPANQGGACDDGVACTKNDTCSNGVCAGAVEKSCINGDGCCPVGCTQVQDDDCTCNINLALDATPSISSGGTIAPYTVSNFNDGKSEPNNCEFAWISDNTAPSGAWMMYEWPAAVTIGSFYVETDNATNPVCGSPGRNIASGTVQWWDGGKWVTATTFSGKKDDVQIDLNPSVTTTRLRVFDMTTDPGNGNSEVFEWHVYQGPGCVPPP